LTDRVPPPERTTFRSLHLPATTPGKISYVTPCRRPHLKSALRREPQKTKRQPSSGSPFCRYGFFIVSSSFQFGSHGWDRLVPRQAPKRKRGHWAGSSRPTAADDVWSRTPGANTSRDHLRGPTQSGGPATTDGLCLVTSPSSLPLSIAWARTPCRCTYLTLSSWALGLPSIALESRCPHFR
jgi:hypothetical protein